MNRRKDNISMIFSYIKIEKKSQASFNKKLIELQEQYHDTMH